MMLKNRLTSIVDELFKIGGNHDVEAMLITRGKLIDFLREEDILFESHDNKNVVLAKDTVRFIDAVIIYKEENNQVEASLLMKPVFSRLLSSESWSYRDLRLLIGGITCTESVKQALELSDRLLNVIPRFHAVSGPTVGIGIFANNMCARLLYAKYYGKEEPNIDLANTFQSWHTRLKYLAEEKSELTMFLVMTQARYALFNNDTEAAFDLCGELKAHHDEKVAEIFKEEVKFYLACEKYDY